MAKKNFDDFIDSVEKPRRPSPEEAARMVAQVHGQEILETPKPAEMPEIAAKKVEPKPAAPPKIAQQKTVSVAAARRGRPRTERNETERLYRLSVDLPGSLLLKLKGAAMSSGTDMKTYVRDLLEEHLAKKG